MGYSDTNFFRPEGTRNPTGPTSKPYATVKLHSPEILSVNMVRVVPSSDTDHLVTPTQVPPDLIEVIDSIESITTSVQFFRDGNVDGVGRPIWGEGALSRASSLVKRMNFSHVVDKMFSFGLGFMSASQIRDLSTVVDGVNERRAQVDLEFVISSPEAVALQMFKSAEIGIKMQQPDGSINEVIT